MIHISSRYLEVSLNNFAFPFFSTDHEPLNRSHHSNSHIKAPSNHICPDFAPKHPYYCKKQKILGVSVIRCCAGVFDRGEYFVVNALLHALLEVDRDNDNGKDSHNGNDDQKTG